jgi:hypothetical protein
MAKKSKKPAVPGEKLLTVRIPADLYASFTAATDGDDLTKSQVIRYMIRWYVSDRKSSPGQHPYPIFRRYRNGG